MYFLLYFLPLNYKLLHKKLLLSSLTYINWIQFQAITHHGKAMQNHLHEDHRSQLLCAHCVFLKWTTDGILVLCTSFDPVAMGMHRNKIPQKAYLNTNVLYFTLSPLFPFVYLTVQPLHKSNNTLKGFKLQKDYTLYCVGKALLMPVGIAHCNLILHFK